MLTSRGNPVLMDVRVSLLASHNPEDTLQVWLEWLDDGHGLAFFTPEQCVHARRVIALWLSVFGD